MGAQHGFRQANAPDFDKRSRPIVLWPDLLPRCIESLAQYDQLFWAEYGVIATLHDCALGLARARSQRLIEAPVAHLAPAARGYIGQPVV